MHKTIRQDSDLVFDELKTQNTRVMQVVYCYQ